MAERKEILDQFYWEVCDEDERLQRQMGIVKKINSKTINSLSEIDNFDEFY